MANRVLTIAGLGAALTLASPALATDMVFGKPGVNTGNVSSLPYTSSDGKITATVTGWSTASTTGTTTNPVPTRGSIGDYAGYGLYVSNGVDKDYNNADWHYIDNQSSYDFVAITFSTAVNLSNVEITAFRTVNSNGTTNFLGDSDNWVVGTNAADWATNANLWDSSKSGSLVSSSSLKANSYAAGTATFSGSNTYGYYTEGTNSPGLFAKTWLIGADRSGRDSTADYFKIKSITITAAPGAVPEPATWATMVLGFGLLGGALRRRGRGRLAAA